MTKQALFSLIGELEADVAELERLGDLNFRAWTQTQLAILGMVAPVGWGEVASTLVSLYAVLEAYFLRVIRFFENDLPEERWHRVLVEKMALNLATRPALLTNEVMVNTVLTWVKFYRHGLKFPEEVADAERTAAMQRRASPFLELFPITHKAFVAKLVLLVPAS